LAVAIGTMSGTSMDGVDVALIETDGEVVSRFGAYLSREYTPTERHILRGAVNAAKDMTDRTARPGPVAEAERLVTEMHLKAIDALIQREGIPHDAVDVVGFHGQTILHRPERRLTVQIGDGILLARRLKIPVVYDFRAADVAAGGQGAPLVPVFHRALLRAFDDGPIVVVNIGGVANVSYLDGAGDPIAFDTGPGNAPMDDLMLTRSGKPMDEGGTIAASGRADEKRVASVLGRRFFSQTPPKSLDREDFARFDFAGLSLPDALATAAEIVTASIALSRKFFPKAPQRWVVAGGGARNPTLVKLLREKLSPAKVQTAEEIGWQSGAVEAQAFAFLAVRSMKGLPLSFPSTTGVPRPMTGGVLVRP
jgi:anhydro-N-acetylmuramic acid kinase